MRSIIGTVIVCATIAIIISMMRLTAALQMRERKSTKALAGLVWNGMEVDIA